MSAVRMVTFEPLDVTRFVESARWILENGEPMESVWRHLRASGCTIGESIQVTMALTGQSNAEAKSAVYWSDTWASMRPAIDQLHDACEQAAIEMGGEVREVDAREPAGVGPKHG